MALADRISVLMPMAGEPIVQEPLHDAVSRLRGVGQVQRCTTEASHVASPRRSDRDTLTRRSLERIRASMEASVSIHRVAKRRWTVWSKFLRIRRPRFSLCNCCGRSCLALSCLAQLGRNKETPSMSFRIQAITLSFLRPKGKIILAGASVIVGGGRKQVACAVLARCCQC